MAERDVVIRIGTKSLPGDQPLKKIGADAAAAQQNVDSLAKGSDKLAVPLDKIGREGAKAIKDIGRDAAEAQKRMESIGSKGAKPLTDHVKKTTEEMGRLNAKFKEGDTASLRFVSGLTKVALAAAAVAKAPDVIEGALLDIQGIFGGPSEGRRALKQGFGITRWAAGVNEMFTGVGPRSEREALELQEMLGPLREQKRGVKEQGASLQSRGFLAERAFPTDRANELRAVLGLTVDVGRAEDEASKLTKQRDQALAGGKLLLVDQLALQDQTVVALGRSLDLDFKRADAIGQIVAAEKNRLQTSKESFALLTPFERQGKLRLAEAVETGVPLSKKQFEAARSDPFIAEMLKKKALPGIEASWQRFADITGAFEKLKDIQIKAGVKIDLNLTTDTTYSQIYDQLIPKITQLLKEQEMRWRLAITEAGLKDQFEAARARGAIFGP